MILGVEPLLSKKNGVEAEVVSVSALYKNLGAIQGRLIHVLHILFLLVAPEIVDL